ncbi:hypothetical protein EN41_16130 [Agrobacterium tumefaciens]|uniref:hypothetical protein n=1 Tax=Agrobacterium fabrum TaxID=1176649 RepID=UPI0002E9BFAF|nr:hypothetical protein [Agrobacterium fabrum]KEY55302.1 hypothetical protein EN41_16130 [Agrobacterium tumefaciens]MCX2874262.1 hypothetical protein [Agrobacterium fabrum]NMV68419.1 hypothetical protein [Agrobacterium fabrum]NSZ10970.1 hypothetical protein [Agrobacterium fabrum]QQN06270.1 hypothetical protein EML4058_02885 [Agrobacterium fabrum]
MFDFTHLDLHIESEAPRGGSVADAIGRRRFAAFVRAEYGLVSSFSKDRIATIDCSLFVDNITRWRRCGFDFDQGKGGAAGEI